MVAANMKRQKVISNLVVDTEAFAFGAAAKSGRANYCRTRGNATALLNSPAAS